MREKLAEASALIARIQTQLYLAAKKARLVKDRQTKMEIIHHIHEAQRMLSYDKD